MNRRKFLAGAAALAATPLVARIPAAGATSTGCFWGIGATPDLDPQFWTYSATLEGELGRKFAGFRWNGTKNLSVPDQAYGRGWHWAYTNGKPDPPNGNYAGYWTDTANGVYDAYWTAYFKAVKADSRWTTANPLHFSFHHEQSVSSEGGGTGTGTPAEYAAAFRHVASVADSVGAHVSKGGNMARAFTPMWTQIANTGNPFYVAKCDPGAAYYEVLGVDCYLKSTASFTAAHMYQPVHDYALKVGKPWFTGEMGVAGSDTKVITYLKALDALLKQWGAGTAPGQVVALNWTTRAASGGDYRMDATSTRLAQYKQMAADPFYSATV